MTGLVEFTMKQGDTLLADCIHKDADGNPVDLTMAGYEIVSAVVDGSGYRHDLEVTLKDQGVTLGGFTVQGESAAWAPGTDCQWDIRYTENGGRSYATRTIRFALGRRVA